jgi:glycosyltransferase involved in cell wall biosynthesis
MTRVILHDYGGYPFPIQLSRALAHRGHEVLHLHAAGFRTPKGFMERRDGDPPTFTIEGLALDEPSQEDRFTRRLFQERRYGKLLARRIAAFDPEVVISATSLLSAQAAAEAASHRAGAAFVFWVQDLYSIAVGRILGRRIPIVGRLIGGRFEAVEQRILRASDAVIAITAEFLPTLARWRIPEERISVIENWAPLDEVVPGPKANPWSLEHGIAEAPVFLYAGTLGRKHDPAILLALAQAVPEAKVVAVAEGHGADWLRQNSAASGNLILLPFQPPNRLPEVLASADVLVALLEPDAGSFSVPSKVLTYLTAGRAILASIPPSNLAAAIIRRASAGRVVDAGDTKGFLDAARALISDPAAQSAAARSGRAYAMATFDIDLITDRFESIIGECAPPGVGPKMASPPDTSGSLHSPGPETSL